MIPVIYDSNEKAFTSNGLGRLTDCISCLVTEERNGIYECEFTYPVTGMHYDKIQEGNIIVVSHDEQKDRQPFVIYRISRPISGVVTVNAHHVSYKLSNVIVSPFSAVSVTDAFNSIVTNSMTDNPFTFWTNKASAGTMNITVPTVCKSLLGGMKGSVLESFGGGEYKWDGYTVKLYANRGSDNGVTIRYGKNLTNVVAERDTLGLYNAVIPYWTDSENTVVYGGIVSVGGIVRSGTWTDENNVHITDENNTDIEFKYVVRQVTTMDLSAEFEDQPTVQELETRASEILSSNKPWIPKDNIKVDFVALWQTEEYANIAPLERVQLCDTVSVYYPELGVDVKAKVVKVVWDALLDRYESIELGDAQTSFADVITAETNEKLENVPNISMMDAAIQHATDLITGGLGGHIVFLYDANGKPTDMLVMDTEDVSTAVNVLRINVNGIGFSSTGVSGTYTSAWTLDGSFVADFITAGHLSANRIQGGTLTLGGANNGNGVIVVYDANGTEIGRWDKDGLSAKGNLEMNRARSIDGVYHINECKIGYGNMLVKDGTSNVTPYSRAPSMGFILMDRSRLTSSSPLKYTFYKSINTSGRWADNSNQYQSETTYMTSYGVRCVLVSPMNTGLDETALDSSGSLSTLLDYVSSYTDFTEEVAYFGEVRWRVRGYGSYLGDDYSGIDAGMTLGKKGHINATQDVWMSSNIGPTTTGARSIYCTDLYPNWRIQGQVTSGLIAVQGSSAKRYKHDITNQICEELDAHRLYDLPMKQFVFNDDFKDWQYPDMKGKTLPGFIAEDVEAIYPGAAIHDENGQIESWDERRVIPGMLKLIQEQKEQIDMLEKRLAKLEAMMGV